MKDLGSKAVSIKVGYKIIAVTTEEGRIILFNASEENNEETEKLQKLLDDYYNKFKDEFDLKSFWIRNNNVQKDNGLAMCLYVKQRATESYEPLVVEVTKDEFELVKKVDVPLEISEERKAKQEFLHKRWTTAVQV